VSSVLLAVLGILGTFGMAAIGDMVSAEVRDRLDRLPHAILRLAARRLDPAQYVTVYEDEWLAELTYILKGDEARPITRLVHGTRYALGILASANRITRHLHRAADQPQSALVLSRAELEEWLHLNFRATTMKIGAFRDEITVLNLAVHSTEPGPDRTVAVERRRELETAIVGLNAKRESYWDALVRLARDDLSSLIPGSAASPPRPPGPRTG
jgi:hypothetical protein